MQNCDSNKLDNVNGEVSQILLPIATIVLTDSGFIGRRNSNVLQLIYKYSNGWVFYSPHRRMCQKFWNCRDKNGLSEKRLIILVEIKCLKKIRIVYNFHRNQVVVIGVEQQVGEANIANVVRQACTLLLTIFGLYIEAVDEFRETKCTGKI